MKILAIETSCDETAAAVTDERKVLSQVVFSQITMHKKWGGVVPNLAKRAHEEHIDEVIQKALSNAHIKMTEIDAFAVTYGPGLAIALEVGLTKAKELAIAHKKPLIPVNHMAGHLYSSFVQNSQGKPTNEFKFPYLSLLISGGHTEFVIFKNHQEYEIIGEKIDDAAGEALDKGARMLGLGYPGGAILERLAEEVNFKDIYHFPRPMIQGNNLDFSFSGLKTSFYYFLKKMSEEDKINNLKELASSYHQAIIDTILIKTEKAITQTGINNIIIGGGVSANKYLRKRLRTLVKKYKGTVLFPTYNYLTGDNAGMIGVAGYFNKQNAITGKEIIVLERQPRLRLDRN